MTAKHSQYYQRLQFINRAASKNGLFENKAKFVYYFVFVQHCLFLYKFSVTNGHMWRDHFKVCVVGAELNSKSASQKRFLNKKYLLSKLKIAEHV